MVLDRRKNFGKWAVLTWTAGQITECKRASVVKAVVSNHCGWDLSLSLHPKDAKTSSPRSSTKNYAEIVIEIVI